MSKFGVQWWLPITAAFVTAFGGWSLLHRAVHTERPVTYFRLKVGLSHKGQPIDFDVVVGCGVRVQSHRYDGASVEIMALYPLVYAKPIPGGHAVKVRTLPVVDGYDICQKGGTSDNGAVPPEWMPFITWYDKADDLSHGIGYATSDAYTNPNSQLEYHGARIEKATKQDFESFMASAPPNLVPAYNAGWMTQLDAPRIKSAADITEKIRANPRSAWPLTGWPICNGVLRFKLDERQRQLVQRYWPSSHPRIWAPNNWNTQIWLHLEGGLFRDQSNFPDLRKWMTPERNEAAHRGAPPAIYPTSSDLSLDRLKADIGKDGVYYYDSMIGDGKAQKGFVYCDTSNWTLATVVTGRRVGPALPNYVSRIDGVAIPTSAGDSQPSGLIAFDRDQYAFVTIADTFFD